MPHEWKVRSMDETVSRSAVAAAERAHMTTAVWLGQAILDQIAREREVLEGEVVGPGKPAGGSTGAVAGEWTVTPLDILHAPTAPKWLRAGASRLLATQLGITPPKGGKIPARRLAAPEAHGDDGGTCAVPPNPPETNGGL